MKQVLIILRGAPASGKSTISKKICNFEKKTIWLKVDNFKDFFGDTDEALEYVNGSAVATLKYLLDKGFSVVMDGVFQNTPAIDEAVQFANSKNIRVIVYQLTCSLKVLQERDKVRPGVPEGIRRALGDETIAKIHEKLANSFYTGARVLDTELKTLDECINQIKEETGINY